MASNKDLHVEIKALRSKGLTYSEINKKLGTAIPKSSMSYICRNISLSQAQKARISTLVREALIINRQKAIAANRNIQIALAEDIRERSLGYARLRDREAKIALAMLYLGEGSKRHGFKGLALGSSDSNIILIYIGLMKKCYGIEADEFKCRVLYRADQDLEKLEDFWSKLTNIPRGNFYKTKPDSRTIGKPTLKGNYKGVFVLYRKGTGIQLELQTIADIIGENMGM